MPVTSPPLWLRVAAIFTVPPRTDEFAVPDQLPAMFAVGVGVVGLPPPPPPHPKERPSAIDTSSSNCRDKARRVGSALRTAKARGPRQWTRSAEVERADEEAMTRTERMVASVSKQYADRHRCTGA